MLAAAGDERRQVVGKRTAEGKLAFQATLLQPFGQRQAELQHLVIEKWRAQLERMRHRRDVGLRKQVAGKVGGDVEVLEAGDACDGRTAEHQARREERPDRGLGVFRPELGTL